MKIVKCTRTFMMWNPANWLRSYCQVESCFYTDKQTCLHHHQQPIEVDSAGDSPSN